MCKGVERKLEGPGVERKLEGPEIIIAGVAGVERKLEGPEIIIAGVAGVERKLEGPEIIIAGVAGVERKLEGPEIIIAGVAGVESKLEGPEIIIAGVAGVESKLEGPEIISTGGASESDGAESKLEGPEIREVASEGDGVERKPEGPEMVNTQVSEDSEFLKELLKYVPKWCVGNEYAKQVLKFGAGCAGDAVVGYALGLVVPSWILRKVWFIYQAKSVLTNPGKLMKAPGKEGAVILRQVFEKDPKAYFRALRGKL